MSKLINIWNVIVNREHVITLHVEASHSTLTDRTAETDFIAVLATTTGNYTHRFHRSEPIPEQVTSRQELIRYNSQLSLKDHPEIADVVKLLLLDE